MNNTTNNTATETMTTRTEILATLRDLDRGDGCLGITVDACLADGITDADAIRAIVEEAEADARIERERETTGTLHDYDTAE